MDEYCINFEQIRYEAARDTAVHYIRLKHNATVSVSPLHGNYLAINVIYGMGGIEFVLDLEDCIKTETFTEMVARVIDEVDSHLDD